jgi:hypothetical protein
MSTDTTRPDGNRNATTLAVAATFVFTAVLVLAVLVLGNRQMRLATERERVARAEEERLEVVNRGALWVPLLPTAEIALHPLDERWHSVPVAEIKLFKQTDAMPMLDRATVETAEIRGVTDGARVVWRLAWRDETKDANVDSGRFSDACALQFPLTDGASHTMGDDHHAVHILHWKGIWQHDVDEHFQDVQDLHPNYWTDLYWFAEGPAPNRVPDDFSDPRSHAWFAAYQAGNPLADFLRQRPVEELSATGFGSLTHQDEAAVNGHGVWADNHWYVTFVRPLETDDPLDYQFARGDTGAVGVAIWNGADGNVGGRKHWGNWVEFVVSP